MKTSDLLTLIMLCSLRVLSVFFGVVWQQFCIWARLLLHRILCVLLFVCKTVYAACFLVVLLVLLHICFSYISCHTSALLLCVPCKFHWITMYSCTCTKCYLHNLRAQTTRIGGTLSTFVCCATTCSRLSSTEGGVRSATSKRYALHYCVQLLPVTQLAAEVHARVDSIMEHRH